MYFVFRWDSPLKMETKLDIQTMRKYALKGVELEIAELEVRLELLRKHKVELTGEKKQVKQPAPKKIVRSPAYRKAHSERMKNYWAKRKASAKKATK